MGNEDAAALLDMAAEQMDKAAAIMWAEGLDHEQVDCATQATYAAHAIRVAASMMRACADGYC